MSSALRSIVESLIVRARESGELTAYTFIEDDQSADVISWAELLSEVRRRAADIALRTDAGDRVLIVLRPGLDYIIALFACFLAGRVAVPTVPQRTRRAGAALAAIAADSGARLLICAPEARAQVNAQFADFDVAIPRLLLVSEESDAGEFPCHGPEAEQLALLQYTSGSTGRPRGVAIRHANLLHNLERQRQLYGVGPDSRGVIWLPPYHDMGLGSGVLQPLYSGSDVVLMSPLRAMQQPLRWLRCIDETRATISGGPPFAFAACVAAAKDLPLQDLDLSSWQCAFVGAEPISLAILEAFAERFAGHGFRRSAFQPSYGLAEATLLVAGARRGRGPSEHPVRSEVGPPRTSCGQGFADGDLLIVDPESHVVRPAGEEGEIWIRDPSVAAGYWGDDEATARVFQARLADGEGPFLRTGDLGMLVDGELAVTGRIKDLVIFAGRKVHAEDVEVTVRRAGDGRLHHAVAAISIGRAGDERLAVLVEAPRALNDDDRAALRVAIVAAVSEDHAIALRDLAFVAPGRLPRTSSGKVRRHLCREMFAQVADARSVSA